MNLKQDKNVLLSANPMKVCLFVFLQIQWGGRGGEGVLSEMTEIPTHDRLFLMITTEHRGSGGSSDPSCKTDRRFPINTTVSPLQRSESGREPQRIRPSGAISTRG